MEAEIRKAQDRTAVAETKEEATATALSDVKGILDSQCDQGPGERCSRCVASQPLSSWVNEEKVKADVGEKDSAVSKVCVYCET